VPDNNEIRAVGDLPVNLQAIRQRNDVFPGEEEVEIDASHVANLETLKALGPSEDEVQTAADAGNSSGDRGVRGLL
jgi:hypothetical protein